MRVISAPIYFHIQQLFLSTLVVLFVFDIMISDIFHFRHQLGELNKKFIVDAKTREILRDSLLLFCIKNGSYIS